MRLGDEPKSGAILWCYFLPRPQEKTAEALLQVFKKLPLRVFRQHVVNDGGDLHGPYPKVKLRPAALGENPGTAGS